jgi:outer membrane protein, multidrug efflux system
MVTITMRPSASRILYTFLLISTIWPATSAAQTTDPPLTPTPRPAPPKLEVNDPLLTPVPPAQQRINSWKEAMSLATARTVDLRNALINIRRAEASSQIALAGVLPTLTGNASVNQTILRTITQPLTGNTEVQSFPANARTYTGSLTLNVPIIAPQAWYAIGTADRSIEISKMSYADQRRQLVALLASSMVNVITSERVADLNRIGLRNALERLKLTQRRVELGAASKLDLVRIQQDAAVASAQIVTANESLIQARESLGLGLGFNHPVGVSPNVSLKTITQDALSMCHATESIDYRPDVMAANKQIELAERKVTDVNLGFLPTVSLQSTYSVSAQPFVNTLVDKTIGVQSWSVAGVLRWNIYDGGVRYGSLKDTRAQVEQARLTYENVRRQVNIEAARAKRSITVADKSLTISTKARDLAKEADRLARLNFELGVGTTLDLVDAARRLREAEVQLAVKEFEAFQAHIKALLTQATCSE